MCVLFCKWFYFSLDIVKEKKTKDKIIMKLVPRNGGFWWWMKKFNEEDKREKKPFEMAF
jgi:hypothetical protein